MDFPLGTDAEVKAIIQAALKGEMKESQARKLAALDSVLIQFALLAMANRVAVLQAALGSA